VETLTSAFTSFFTFQPFLVQCAEKYYEKTVFDSPIAQFYSFTTSQNTYVTWAVPDGCIDFEFHCDPEKPEAFIYGSVTTGRPFYVQPGVTYFGVRYHPGVYPHRLGLFGMDLADSRISLDQIPGGWALVEAIAAADSFEKRVELFCKSDVESAMDWDEMSKTRLLYTVLQIILQKKGNVRISEIEHDTGYTARNIHYLFLRYMGICPKAYCKFIRFQALLGDIHRCWWKPLSVIGNDVGYYDHSHMLRDFKAFTSYNLQQYIKVIDLPAYAKKIIVLPPRQEIRQPTGTL
jgi:methylphosphotriester-DNA--protein-cysteine methyltransferase